MPSKASPKTVRITWEDLVAWMVKNAKVLVTNAQRQGSDLLCG